MMCDWWIRHTIFVMLIGFCPTSLTVPAAGASQAGPERQGGGGDGRVVKKVLGRDDAGENVLKADAWRPWQKGFERRGDVFICDNGADSEVQRGVSQTVRLDQTTPEPIVATARSMSRDVGGGRNSDYSLYLDLVYSDGTTLWGQVDAFEVGTHDWEQARVLVFPDKPIRSVSFHMLLRRHAGEAWFGDPQLRVLRPPSGARLFDGVAVAPAGGAREGFAVRDVAAGSDFVGIEREALGLEMESRRQRRADAVFHDVTVSETTGSDRAVTLVYTVPVACDDCRWLEDPRRSHSVERGREYVGASSFAAGFNGRLSRYPFAAVEAGGRGVGIGIDMSRPAFFRAGYNAGTGELFLAYDIGLAGEKPTAEVRFCRFDFDPKWGFRAALEKYYEIFPDHFRRRVSQQGLWMPFAKISDVNDWRDFGFAFKEGANETGWDDENGIITFRYTEPMTWWMRMSEGTPRTLSAALAEAQRLAAEKNDPRAKAFLTSGFHDEKGRFPARILDTPWCDGAVWSINSMPGIKGEATDFKNKWSAEIRGRLYGPDRRADLDGEYIDSSEGYVTDELDFRRDHFAASRTALTFSQGSGKPAIFRGLIAFEYVDAIAADVHAAGKLMMANSTPIRLCWLAPLLDVMGTETDWNPGGTWRPMSDAELLYRRAMCRGKPYCFLMNTRFEDFSHALVDKYMKRSLAYGMFPGFFSHNASQGHYFTRPELYERDRDLFRKYVPLCRRVAEAGWEPITLAVSSDERVYLERFGKRYLTVFNDSTDRRTVTITLERRPTPAGRELVRQRPVQWRDRQTTLTLDGEDVAVIETDWRE